MSGASLGVPGVLYVGTSGEQELAELHVGPVAGWVALKGIHTWSREISVVFKADVTEAIGRELGVTLPERQPEAAGLQNALRAAQASSLVAVDSSLVDKLVGHGVRVHTIGSDRITGGFYYLAKGGKGEAVRLQGNLVEMVAATMAASADNAAIEANLDGVIPRVLAELSGGTLSEAQIELTATLPALGEPAAEAAVKLQTLEGFLVLTMARASRYADRAHAALEALDQATRGGEHSLTVPLFGDARRVVQPELEIEYAEGESGERRRLKLPERSRWFVDGVMTETMPPPAVAPKAAEETTAEKAAAEKAAVEKAAAEKAAAEKAAADKAAAEKAAAVEKAAADKAAAEKAAAVEKAAVEKAAAERAALEKAAADKAAAETAAVEKAAAEKAAAERALVERAAAAMAAIEKAEADRLAAEKLAVETALALEKAAAKKAEAQAAAQKAAQEKKAADQAAAEKAAAKKKRASAAGERAKEQAAVRTKSDERKVVPAKADTKPTPLWVWLLVLFVVAGGGYYFAFVRGHG
jgi:hypothetical protein